MFSVSNVSFIKVLSKTETHPNLSDCWIHWQSSFIVSFILSVTGDSLVVILLEFRILFLSMFCLIRVTRGLSMFIASAFDEQFVTYKTALSTCSDQWFLMQQLLQPNSRLFYDPLQISHASTQSLPGPDPVNQYASFGSIWFAFSESYTIYGLFQDILFLEFIRVLYFPPFYCSVVFSCWIWNI